MRNLILSGGVSHPLEATSALVAGVLAGEGIDSTVTEDIEAGLAALGDFDLLTVNALRWRMLAERFAPQRERFALSLSARARESIPAHLAGGRGILALHTAPICFDDWEEWRRVVGAAWNWERSRHPPLGPVRVSVGPGTHPITAGLEDFEVVDEVYGFMDYEADLDPLATSAHGGVDHPLLWAREVDGGRVVYDALGHDERSLSQPTHQEILRRAGRWLLDKG